MAPSPCFFGTIEICPCIIPSSVFGSRGEMPELKFGRIDIRVTVTLALSDGARCLRSASEGGGEKGIEHGSRDGDGSRCRGPSHQRALIAIPRSQVQTRSRTWSELKMRVTGFLRRFIGEESAAAGKRVEFTDAPTWIIDPIDGTTNFVHRSVSTPSISIAIHNHPTRI